MSTFNPFDAMTSERSAGDKQPKSTKRPATKREILVYTLKKNGRTASGPNVHARASLAKAMGLAAQGQGGIVTALRPKTNEEAARLIKDLRTYDVELVKPREPIRLSAAREQLLSAAFLWKLVEICPATEKWKRLDFAKWLHAELLKRGSIARSLAAQHAPDFLLAERSLSWLYRTLGQEKM